MRLTCVGIGGGFGLGPGPPGELLVRIEEGAPRVRTNATVLSGSQPPLFDLSCAETGQYDVGVGPTGLRGARRRLAVGRLNGAAEAEVGAEDVVVVEHLECRSVVGGWREFGWSRNT